MDMDVPEDEEVTFSIRNPFTGDGTDAGAVTCTADVGLNCVKPKEGEDALPAASTARACAEDIIEEEDVEPQIEVDPEAADDDAEVVEHVDTFEELVVESKDGGKG